MAPGGGHTCVDRVENGAGLLLLAHPQPRALSLRSRAVWVVRLDPEHVTAGEDRPLVRAHAAPILRASASAIFCVSTLPSGKQRSAASNSIASTRRRPLTVR